jgi:hypothetical protein
MGEGRGAYRILVGRPEEMRRRRIWEDNFEMDHKDTEWEGVGWIDVAQDRNN